MPITIGETILPKIKPNLNQIVFKGVSIFELDMPKIKKINAITKDQILICSLCINGQNEIIRKTIKNVNPKFLFDTVFLFSLY